MANHITCLYPTKKSRSIAINNWHKSLKDLCKMRYAELLHEWEAYVKKRVDTFTTDEVFTEIFVEYLTTKFIELENIRRSKQ